MFLCSGGSSINGFGDEDVPGRLVVETAGVDDEEYVVSVSREKPPSAPLSPTQASSKIIPKAKSRVSGATGTLSRSKVYLLGMVESKFKFAKLPKTKAVLSVFLSNFKETEGFEMAAAQEAAEIVLVQLKGQARGKIDAKPQVSRRRKKSL